MYDSDFSSFHTVHKLKNQTKFVITNSSGKKYIRRRIFSFLNQIKFFCFEQFVHLKKPLAHNVYLYLIFFLFLVSFQTRMKLCVIRSKMPEIREIVFVCVDAMPALTELDKLKSVQTEKILIFTITALVLIHSFSRLFDTY